VFALEIRCNGRTIIRLNPSYFIANNIEENNICVYCLCPDPFTAERIETIKMNKEEKNKYLIMKAIKSKQENKMKLEPQSHEDPDPLEKKKKVTSKNKKGYQNLP